MTERVHIERNSTVTVASIYITEGTAICTDEITKIITELLKPVLLLGDFNAHNCLWGDNNCTLFRRRQIEEIVTRQQMMVLNNGAATHISGTATDLSLVSPELTPVSYWETYDYEITLSSDRYLIIISIAKQKARGQHNTSFNFKKAKWEIYGRDQAWKQLPKTSQKTTLELVEDMYRRLDIAAGNSCPKYVRKRYSPKPWWSVECMRGWK